MVQLEDRRSGPCPADPEHGAANRAHGASSPPPSHLVAENDRRRGSAAGRTSRVPGDGSRGRIPLFFSSQAMLVTWHRRGARWPRWRRGPPARDQPPAEQPRHVLVAPQRGGRASSPRLAQGGLELGPVQEVDRRAQVLPPLRISSAIPAHCSREKPNDILLRCNRLK